MMRLYTHAACLDHDPGPEHPESPARLRAVLKALDHDRFAALDRVEAPRATDVQLRRAHTASHVESMMHAAPTRGRRTLDADTFLSPGSVEAALHAAGAVCAAVDAACDGSASRAFCAVRPPGHHATADTAMGFCLFNSVAIGAHHALAMHGFKRVAIVDFDVHHGNGTQDIMVTEPRVMYASSHQMPLYPGSGETAETGSGNIINAPLPPASGSADFRATWNDILLPRLFAFRPQLVLISAGFDGHAKDPLAGLELESDDFVWLTERLLDLSAAHADGRLVSSLEGGYDLNALAACVSDHVATLMHI